MGSVTLFLPLKATSNGAVQYRFALVYFSMMLIHPPDPTGSAFPLRMPSRFDSTWTYPTGKPWIEKISSDFSAIVS